MSRGLCSSQGTQGPSGVPGTVPAWGGRWDSGAVSRKPTVLRDMDTIPLLMVSTVKEMEGEAE